MKVTSMTLHHEIDIVDEISPDISKPVFQGLPFVGFGSFDGFGSLVGRFSFVGRGEGGPSGGGSVGGLGGTDVTPEGTSVVESFGRFVGEAAMNRVGVPVGEGDASPVTAVGVSSGLTGNRGMSAMR